MGVVARRYQAMNNLVRTLPDFGMDIVEGSLSLSCSFESHPSGSLVVKSIPEREIGLYRSHFSQIGKEFDIYGYKVVIDSYSETKDTIEGPDIEVPISVYDIGINLVGKWQQEVNCPVFIRTRSAINNVSLAGTVSLAGLARRAGINYSGYSYDISVPNTSGNGYTLTFGAEVQKKLRLNEKIIDYTGDTVLTKDWKSGNTWNLTRNEILSSVESSIQKPIFYKRTRLEGSGSVLEKSKSAVAKEKRKALFNDDPLVLKPPEIRTLVTGDVGVQGIPQNTDALTMPEDVKTLESMDLNFDASGPRKTIRETTTINNKVVREVVKQYGFAYLMRQVANPLYESLDDDFIPEDTPVFLVTNPQQYWTQIEEQVTSYIYKPVRGNMEIEAEDTVTKEKFTVKYLDETGKKVKTAFSKKYLTEVITQGWKLGRFQTESENTDTDSRAIEENLADETLPDIDREYYLLQKRSIEFQKFPLKTIKSYLLVDPNEYYDKTEDVPFQTQKVARKDLGLKSRGDDFVIIATPSLDYVYPMMVMAETSQTHSFATLPNPENVYNRFERKASQNNPNLTPQQVAEDLRDIKIVAELTYGEDSFQTTKRSILPSKNTTRRIPKDRKIQDDVMVEYSYGASNQDQNFKNSLQNISFTESFSRPSTADVLTDIYVKKSELTNNTKKKVENTKKPVYYLTNKDAPKGCSTLETVSFGTSLFSEALSQAKLDLVMQNFLSTSEENMQLSYLHSAIKPGDFVNSVDSFTKRRKRVKSVSFALDYNGYVEGLGKFVTCSGTNISLGIFDETLADNILVTKEFENSADGLKISANVNINEKVLGESPVLANLRTRRNR